LDKIRAKLITGGLSNTSKMPCKSYSLPATKCNVGSKLVDIKGSVCNDCYALKGMYRFPNVKNAMEKRYKSVDHVEWVDAMVTLIGKDEYFRWHDSGDIIDLLHLSKICEVCIKTPNCTHWLPTREYLIVKTFIDIGNTIPVNLTIRLSALMVDGKAPQEFARRYGLTTSGVGKDDYTCPAPKQDNECKNCRACWDKKVPTVSYRLHYCFYSEKEGVLSEW
jgi:hypothetical protein